MATGTTTVSSAVGRGSSLSHIKVSVLKEGNLLKRQRGRSSGADLRRLKWQQRYISLTPDYLYYYSDQKVRPTMIPRTVSYVYMYVRPYVYVLWRTEEERRVSCKPDENR